MSQRDITRRQFLGGTAAVAAGVILTGCGGGGGSGGGSAGTRTATDAVPLGQTGQEICRLGFGTGTSGGSVQRGLGQEEFTRLIRYGYDRGIRYIDTADSYGTHEMVREAIRGLPRERLWIQSKMPWRRGVPEDPLAELDRFRLELGVDYIDSVLIHVVTEPTWDTDLEIMLDALSEAQDRGLIRLKGVSPHGLPALERACEVKWGDVHLVRINPQGVRCDGATSDWDEPGDMPRVLECIERLQAAGSGVIGMKIIGNGEFTKPEDREKSVQFVMNSQDVDAIVIGFKNMSEIDEAIERMDRALSG